MMGILEHGFVLKIKANEPQTGEQILAKDIAYQGLLSQIYKELLNRNSKKINNPIKQ